MASKKGACRGEIAPLAVEEPPIAEGRTLSREMGAGRRPNARAGWGAERSGLVRGPRLARAGQGSRAADAEALPGASEASRRDVEDARRVASGRRGGADALAVVRACAPRLGAGLQPIRDRQRARGANQPRREHPRAADGSRRGDSTALAARARRAHRRRRARRGVGQAREQGARRRGGAGCAGEPRRLRQMDARSFRHRRTFRSSSERWRPSSAADQAPHRRATAATRKVDRRERAIPGVVHGAAPGSRHPVRLVVAREGRRLWPPRSQRDRERRIRAGVPGVHLAGDSSAAARFSVETDEAWQGDGGSRAARACGEASTRATAEQGAIRAAARVLILDDLIAEHEADSEGGEARGSPRDPGAPLAPRAVERGRRVGHRQHALPRGRSDQVHPQRVRERRAVDGGQAPRRSPRKTRRTLSRTGRRGAAKPAILSGLSATRSTISIDSAIACCASRRRTGTGSTCAGPSRRRAR